MPPTQRILTDEEAVKVTKLYAEAYTQYRLGSKVIRVDGETKIFSPYEAISEGDKLVEQARKIERGS